MRYFRNVTTGAVRKVEADSPDYRRLRLARTEDGRFPLYEETSPEAVQESPTESNTTLTVSLQPSVQAAGNTEVVRAPFSGQIVAVTYTPEANITGANTNTRKISLVNKGQDGNGAVESAALQFNSGVNANDFDEKEIPLSVTPANVKVVKGDVLAVVSAAVGDGLADPGGLVEIDLIQT